MSTNTGATSDSAYDYVRAVGEHVLETKRTLASLPNVPGTHIQALMASLDESYERVRRAEERRRRRV